jgi:hypothetical protein
VILTAEEPQQIDVEMPEWYRRLRIRLAPGAER